MVRRELVSLVLAACTLAVAAVAVFAAAYGITSCIAGILPGCSP